MYLLIKIIQIDIGFAKSLIISHIKVEDFFDFAKKIIF